MVSNCMYQWWYLRCRWISTTKASFDNGQSWWLRGSRLDSAGDPGIRVTDFLKVHIAKWESPNHTFRDVPYPFVHFETANTGVKTLFDSLTWYRYWRHTIDVGFPLPVSRCQDTSCFPLLVYHCLFTTACFPLPGSGLKVVVAWCLEHEWNLS